VNTQLNWRKLGLPVYIVIGLVAVFGALFVYELLSFDRNSQDDSGRAIEPVSESAYVATVNTLLEDANPTNGAILVESYGCIACHRLGATNNIAPSFEGIAARAADRRPPMPAASYIYESIIHPSVYVVDGYPNSMVQNFGSRITNRELGDIIAYLLTSDAR